MKSLVIIGVLALAVTLEGSDVTGADKQFSNVRCVLYRNLLLGERSSVIICLLLKVSVLSIEKLNGKFPHLSQTVSCLQHF